MTLGVFLHYAMQVAEQLVVPMPIGFTGHEEENLAMSDRVTYVIGIRYLA
jgi:hypothetical protein